MLWLVAGGFLEFWLVGMGGVYTIGAIVHLFLLLAIIAVILQIVRRLRRI